MTPRFFCEAFSKDGLVVLEREESHHLVRVLRLQAGDPVTLIDGKGNVGQALVEVANPKGAEVKVTAISHSAPHSTVVLGFGIPKGPAQDFIFRRVTEVGLLAFQPLGTEHSLKAKEFNEERWHRVIPEIAKQCQETHFPEVRPALSLEKALALFDSDCVYFCDEAQRDRPAEPATSAQRRPKLLLIGPEGGWSTRERELIQAKGAHVLSLGINRLRAETACLVAVALLKERLGEINRD